MRDVIQMDHQPRLPGVIKGYYKEPPPPPPGNPLSEPSEKWVKLLVVLLLLGGIAVWFVLFRQGPLPNVGKLPEPIQTALPQHKQLPSLPGYETIATHTYEIKALILSRKRYSSDTGAKFSPVDFALGWGPLTMEPYVNGIKWTQRGRFYNTSWDHSAIPIRDSFVIYHSANTHIVPATHQTALRDTLLSFRRGDLVLLKGYLVVIRTLGGSWRWVSSTTRKDTAGGACEVMYVTSAEKLPLPKQ